MPGQPRKISQSNEKFHAGIGKTMEPKKKENKLPVGPVALGLLIFVVIVSALIQIVNTR